MRRSPPPPPPLRAIASPSFLAAPSSALGTSLPLDLCSSDSSCVRFTTSFSAPTPTNATLVPRTSSSPQISSLHLVGPSSVHAARIQRRRSLLATFPAEQPTERRQARIFIDHRSGRLAAALELSYLFERASGSDLVRAKSQGSDACTVLPLVSNATYSIVHEPAPSGPMRPLVVNHLSARLDFRSLLQHRSQQRPSALLYLGFNDHRQHPFSFMSISVC
ncbi:hypothetical protein HYPSUDRAFT_523988 [Hypholoma sublateritium FD-334 SS-4]|uniref:Uncharacterized protein n=1 Tax=Hypholoma sublateritium (strain FD-334 SS-4) TaxID=945553 RepID=A0A0D2PMH3_HYPSF|nr:hypothetical protein HYPSUDRAFT_523988 [Hypholoma sublateritium FD-334 SS-4]